MLISMGLDGQHYAVLSVLVWSFQLKLKKSRKAGNKYVAYFAIVSVRSNL